MTRVAWSFDNYDWPINPKPDGDTGWIPGELQLSEIVPISKFSSNIQVGGAKSERRQISGWIWGDNATEFYKKMLEWKRDRKQATLRDHLGESRKAMLIRFEPTSVSDSKAFAAGRQTWTYTAEFIEV